MLIDLIAGARPNFMKIAPVTYAIRDLQKGKDNRDSPIRFRLIHTGQHYDKNMSDRFFEQLNIPKPDFNLGAGGGTQAEQTAAIMTGYEKLLTEQGKPDLTMVVGDVTSTMACSITARKMGVRVAHVEGGIRSRDWTMPEEVNRVVTDSVTDFFFTTSETANRNLRREGIPEDRLFFVGNTMIDTLYAKLDFLQKPPVWDELGLTDRKFFVMTLHRPANVDGEQKLQELITKIVEGTDGLPVIFPTHPRTRAILDRMGLEYPGLHFVNPMGYLEFMYLIRRSLAVITDSGGITEETTVLGIPCLTLRDNTERPETITLGTNVLVGTDPAALKPVLARLLRGEWKTGAIPEKWDGQASRRIVQVLIKLETSGRLVPHQPFRDEELLEKG